MSFVIKRLDQGGGYVSKPGHRASYTHDLRHARKFRTREEAEADRCPDNEIVENLEQLLDQYRS
jgi:hypothetical protein